MMFSLLLLLAFLLIILTPIGLSYFIFRLIKNRNYDKRLRLFALIPILIVLYIIYSALFPSNDFYRKDFVEIAGIELPEQVEFKYKSATYPDHHGDYTSISVIKVNKEFYTKLPEILIQEGLKKNEHIIPTTKIKKALEHTEKLEIKKEYSLEDDDGAYYYVGFLTDHQTVIVQRISW